ncbi:MAG: tetratricopeptide repeat protein [Steroidobacteraceae bacterium]|jgi:predicted negative regulator of RcsB-dependent stress response
MTEEYLTDDEQLEEVKRLASEYAPWIIPAVVVGLGFVFGYRYYHNHQEQRAEGASAEFSSMNAAIESNDRTKARQLADALIKDYPKSPYADQAQLVIARLYVDDGEDANAIAPLTQVMEHSADNELRHVARLRLARVQIDQGKPDEALKTLSDDPGAFATAYHEVRGDAYFAKKDIAQAAEQYKAALAEGSGESMDSALLTLKIADLGLPQTPPAPLAGAPPTVPVPADSAAKAKP